MNPLRIDVEDGLKHVLSDTPVGHGYVEALLTASLKQGWEARLEAGYRPVKSLALFGFGFARSGDVGGGVGAKWEF